MKSLATIILWVGVLLCLMLGIAESRTDVLIFSGGQEPQIAKMPTFAYLGTQPLTKDDKILDTVHYTAKGEDIYEKVIEYHQKTYLDKKWNPKNMRLLVTVKNKNKAFSLSGNVQANFQEYTNNQSNVVTPSGQLTKGTMNSIGSSGSIFPSFTQSWIDQKYDIWFFFVE